MTRDTDASRAADAVAPATAGPETAIDPRLTEVGIRRVEVLGGRLEMDLTISKEIAVIFAEWAIYSLDAAGAENYAEMQLHRPDRPGETVTVTIQRWQGQTPHQKRQEAEARVATLEARLRDAERELTGCCAKCGWSVKVEAGPVNDIVCTHVEARCACAPASLNLWPKAGTAATRAAPRGDDGGD